MTRFSKLTKAIGTLIGGLALCGTALSGQVVNSEFERFPADAKSNSGHTVLDQCGGGVEPWDKATASLLITQNGAASTVHIRMRNARPDTVYTTWLRLRGTGPDGSEIGWHEDGSNGSPLTGGGATPLVNSNNLAGVLHYTPPFAGTPSPTNGFVTDANGNANWKVDLDFPIIGGAYPFHRTDQDALEIWQNAGGNMNAKTIPTAIVNPADNMGGPFMLRIVSHCQDGLGHGLSPAARETWFDWPN